ncbi:MAG: molybdopterin oxidoreductase family protein [Chloroflexota bacterium]
MNEQLKSQIQGVCPHDCPDTCGLITHVKEGLVVKVEGDPDHPTTQGWLCAKVRPYPNFVNHPDRLMHPLRRRGPKGSGQWERISWTEALTEIGRRWRQLIDEYGAEAILPYSFSGTLGLIQMSVASGRFWNRLGASFLERTICSVAAKQAVRATLGARWAPPYEHVESSNLVLIWGHNPVSSSPHFMPFLKRAQRQGCEVIVIDPRRTRTAKGADLHVALIPGTDAALALGMAYLIVENGWHNEAWLNQYTVGWPQFKERLADYPLGRVAQITGVDEEVIVDLARQYASTTPALIKILDGVQRNLNGGQGVRAICALPALTGQYGVYGGGLSYNTADYIKWDLDVVNKWSKSPAPGRSVNMNRLGAALTGEITDPPIKSLFVFGSNPATTSPNTQQIIQGLQREDLFTVVHELFMTDTAEYADIVLPATSQMEQVDLHRGTGHTVLKYNRPAIAPKGECKSNWDVMRLLAETMGFTEPWLFDTADDIIDEMVTTLAQSAPAFANLTLERLKSEGAISIEFPQIVPFADGHFPTPSGKVELYCEQLAGHGLDPLPVWMGQEDAGTPSGPRAEALLLVSAAAHHFVSSSFANVDGLLAREGKPFVELNPRDARARNIQSGDLVCVFNGRGSCHLEAKVTDDIRPGVAASPKGHWSNFDPFAKHKNGHRVGRNINWTTPDALADMAGQSTFHSNLVWISKVSAELSPVGTPRATRRRAK